MRGWGLAQPGKNVFERAKVEPTRANVRYLIFGIRRD